MTQRLTRRDAGIRLLAHSALLSGLPLPLLAQSERDPALDAAIATARTQGQALRSTIIDGLIPVDSWAAQVVGFDLLYRIDLARAFEEVSPSDVHLYVPEKLMPVHVFMVNAGVQRVPTVDEVAASPIDLSCRPVSDSNDCTWKVVVDILIDALGVAREGKLLREFLEEDPDMSAKFQSLVQEITNQDWRKVADLLDDLLWEFIFGGGAARLAELITARGDSVTDFFGRMAWKLALRFANILGLLYFSGSLLLAIKTNAPRCLQSDSDGRCP